MLTEKEKDIINRVVAEKAKYIHLESDPPHEQDNIPNPFDVLTSEELDHVRESSQLLELIKQEFKKLRMNKTLL